MTGLSTGGRDCVWPAKPNIFIILPLQNKFAPPYFRTQRSLDKPNLLSAARPMTPAAKELHGFIAVISFLRLEMFLNGVAELTFCGGSFIVTNCSDITPLGARTVPTGGTK